MKIAELKKIKTDLEKKTVLTASELASLQEVNFRLNVNETLIAYFKSLKGFIDNKDYKNSQIVYICFAKYVAELPAAFYFVSAPGTEKGNTQRKANLNLDSVSRKITELSKNAKLGVSIEAAPEKFFEKISEDFKNVNNAFENFRETIIKLN